MYQLVPSVLRRSASAKPRKLRCRRHFRTGRPRFDPAASRHVRWSRTKADRLVRCAQRRKRIASDEDEVPYVGLLEGGFEIARPS